MNSQTSVKSVWNRIRKINRKDTSHTVHHLSVNDRDVTSHLDIANALADNFFHNSSSTFSTAEKQTIKLSCDNAEVYTTGRSLWKSCWMLCVEPIDTSAGHYQLLKHLPSSSLLLLLNF